MRRSLPVILKAGVKQGEDPVGVAPFTVKHDFIAKCLAKQLLSMSSLHRTLWYRNDGPCPVIFSRKCKVYQYVQEC